MANTLDKRMVALLVQMDKEMLIDFIGYDTDNHSAYIAYVKNTKVNIESIKLRLNTVTSKYRFVLLSPKSERTDVKILDVGL